MLRSPNKEKLPKREIRRILSSIQSQFAVRAFELLENRPPELIFQAVKLWMDQREKESKSVTFTDACKAFVSSPFKAHLTETHRKTFFYYRNRFTNITHKLLVEITTADKQSPKKLPTSKF